MGAEQSQDNGLRILNKDIWLPQGFREDSRYGEFKLYTTEDGRQIAVVTQTSQDYNEYATSCAKMNKTKELNIIPGMVKVLELYTKQEGNLCSSFYKLTVVYEYLDQVIDDLYEDFQGYERIFTSEVISSFMSQMLSTLNDLYHHGSTHGDVTPNSILVQKSNTNLYFKLNNVQQMTGQNYYKRMLLEFDSENGIYLSPELIDALSRREIRPNYDCQKADVYSLALTCLEMGTAKIDQGKLFHPETLTLDENVLEALLVRFTQNHGTLIPSLLRQMLQEDASSRPSFSELLNQFNILSAQREQSSNTLKFIQVPLETIVQNSPERSQGSSVKKVINRDQSSIKNLGIETQKLNYRSSQAKESLCMSANTTPQKDCPTQIVQLIETAQFQQVSEIQDSLMRDSDNILNQNNQQDLKDSTNTINNQLKKSPSTQIKAKAKTSTAVKSPLNSLRRPKQEQQQFKTAAVPAKKRLIR